MYSRKPISSVPCAFKDDKYRQLNHVGKGTYGQVFKASRKSDNLEVALKKITEINSHGFSVLALREIHILKSFNHPNLVKMLEVVIEKEPANNSNRQDQAAFSKYSTYLVFEYCQHDLEGMFLANIAFTLAQTKRIILSILLGLAELHRKNIIHRDIKTDNILYTKEKIIKIADFGLSFDMNVNKGRQMTKKMQNSLYRAPEIVLESKYYTTKVDIWSVGIILCSLLFRKHGEGHFNLFPQRTSQEFGQAYELFSLLGNPEDEAIWPVQSREDLAVQLLEPFMGKFTAEQKANFTYKLPQRLREIDPKIDDTTVELICKMLTMDPAQRPSAEECLAHGFFSQSPSVAANSEMPQIEQGQEFHRMTVQTRINKEMQVAEEQKKNQAAPQLPRAFTQQQPRNIPQQQMQGQRQPQQGLQQYQQQQSRQSQQQQQMPLQGQRWSQQQQQQQQQQGNQMMQQQSRNGANNNFIKNMSNFPQQESHRNALPVVRMNNNSNNQCAPGKISLTASFGGGDPTSAMNNPQDSKQQLPQKQQQQQPQQQQQTNKFSQNQQPSLQAYRVPSQNMPFINTSSSQSQQQQYPSILHNSSNKPVLSSNTSKKMFMNQSLNNNTPVSQAGYSESTNNNTTNMNKKPQFVKGSQMPSSSQFQPLKQPQQQQLSSINGNISKQQQFQQNQQRLQIAPSNGSDSFMPGYPQQFANRKPPAKLPFVASQSHLNTIDESSETGNQYYYHDDSQSTEVSNNLDHEGQMQSLILQTPLNTKRKNSYTSCDTLAQLINSSNKMMNNTNNYESNLESPRKKLKVELPMGQQEMNNNGQLSKTQEPVQGLTTQPSQNGSRLQEGNNVIIPEIVPKAAVVANDTSSQTQQAITQAGQSKASSPLVSSTFGLVQSEQQDQQLPEVQQFVLNPESNSSSATVNTKHIDTQRSIPPSPSNSSIPHSNAAVSLNNNNNMITSPSYKNNSFSFCHNSDLIQNNIATYPSNDKELMSPVNCAKMPLKLESTNGNSNHLLHEDLIISDMQMGYYNSPTHIQNYDNLLQYDDQLSPIGFNCFYQNASQQTGADSFSGN